MTERMIAGLLLCMLLGCGGAGNDTAGGGSTVQASAFESIPGFMPMFWDESGGRLFLKIEALDAPLIYQSSLPRGLGSNDIGLDRGQLGDTKLVRFLRSGPRVLLVEDNLSYRALSDDQNERRAVDESFARSVIWGFDVASESKGAVLVDATAFFLRDAHGLAARLAEMGEGSFAPDAGRSAIYLPRTRGFPDNSEVEAIVTFGGRAEGRYLPTVTPDRTSVTVHTHHSFIRLPEDGYEPIAYDPRSGVIGLGWQRSGFYDYASDIGTPLRVDYGRRHRLEKKDPGAEVSEAVEPIVYYVDPGAPEPVRSALIEGAMWWNEAFEAAGYKDAFEVRLLPEDADPMDVRYNVIQWVHRSTRGWSYGSSIMDPRSGEILKGHVTLGSLRVRQDYLIAEGLLAPYDDESVPDAMLEMALARIRQLSAHEVGHTIGFEHNFAASTQDRASVMDYPFPLVRLNADSTLDLSEAYDEGIGEWDKRTVLYAYQDFPDDVDADAARAAIMAETIAAGHKYISDQHARTAGASHPDANLWDNGADAIDELERLLALREHSLAQFSKSAIRLGRPEATLEDVLVPVYLLHRFQLEAVAKLVGGVDFRYTLRGDGQAGPEAVAAGRQREAMAALIATLDEDVLRLPAGLADRIPPPPPGFERSRETFKGATGMPFDPLAPAASAVALTLDALLNPERAARMHRNGDPGFDELVTRLLEASWFKAPPPKTEYNALQRQTNLQVLDGLLRLAVGESVDPAVRAAALGGVAHIQRRTDRAERVAPDPLRVEPDVRAFLLLARARIDRVLDDPAALDAVAPVVVPPGSPIGAASGDASGWIN